MEDVKKFDEELAVDKAIASTKPEEEDAALELGDDEAEAVAGGVMSTYPLFR